MASNNLIQGAGAVAKSQGFVNYAEAINVPNPTQGANFYALERQRKEETKSRVNGYIDQLKSDVDLDGLTAEQQSSLRGFLVSERNKYAYAASEIAKIDDATDPEYQYYVDMMNGVNRSFQTLSNELKSYKDAKKSYVETHQADLYSNAASADDVQIAASLYGLDPEVQAEFSVGDGGHIKFNVGGVEQSYEDYKEPMLKDFKTMNSLLTTTNEIYNAGNKLNDTKIQLLGTQVEAMLANPKSIQSILSGDFAGNGIDLSGIAYNPEDIAGTRMQVKDAIMNALIDVANEGYAEKERKRKKGRDNPSSPTTSYTETQKKYLNVLGEAAADPALTIRIPGSEGLYIWNPEAQGFKPVDSDQNARVTADGEVHYISPEQYAAKTGIKLEDINSKLGLK